MDMASVNRLDDSTVRYKLYSGITRKSSSTSSTTVNDSSCSSSSSSPPSIDSLQLFVIESLAYLNPFLSRYIWQNEPFNLHVVEQFPGNMLVTCSTLLPFCIIQCRLCD